MLSVALWALPGCLEPIMVSSDPGSSAINTQHDSESVSNASAVSSPPDAVEVNGKVEKYLLDAGFRALDLVDLDHAHRQAVRQAPYSIQSLKCCADEGVALALSRLIPILHANDRIYLYYEASRGYLLAGDADAMSRARQTARADYAPHAVREVLIER
jgi:hypothetical protein